MAVDAYWYFANQCDYPLASGNYRSWNGTNRSSEILIRDWVAVDEWDWRYPYAFPWPQILSKKCRVGFEILKSLELRHRGVNVIACPTCGRVEIDVVRMANEFGATA